VCFHLAAQADVRVSVERPDFDADVNVVGTVRVLEAARAHGTQIVFSSTGGALSGECERPAREDDPRRPLSPYGMSKLAGEEYLFGWNRLHGSRHVVLRFGNVYGPRQEPSLEGGVIAVFLDRMAAGQPTAIYGDGTQTRDFIYVKDVVAGMLAAAGHDAGVFNIAAGESTSVSELHRLCRAVSGRDEEPEYGPARPGDLMHSALDPARAREELGWSAATSLEDGLRATWATK
ncbi:MAG: UDP-glucose 4-epimerase, partial [Gaiellaceae bacterium]|nr:UDP-glucose 4-epimerase [Gaiellaceae bacterium]